MTGAGAPRRNFLPGSAVSCLVSFGANAVQIRVTCTGVRIVLLPFTLACLSQVQGLPLEPTYKTLTLKLSQ